MNYGISRAIILAGLLGTPLAAYAQVLDLAPSQDRYLSDPNFLPFSGQLYGTSAYSQE